MAALDLLLWMLPFVAFAIGLVFVGHLAYTARLAKEQAAERARHPAAPDPVLELERVNTELARSAAAARVTLEAARDTVRKGTR